MKELETERLTLRKLHSDDCDRIFSCWANDEEVTRYLTWFPHKSPDETRKILDNWLEEYNNKDCYRFGIELKESRQLVGMLDVVNYRDGKPEIGYVLGKAYWNHGYMTEAFAAVVQYLFEEGFSGIYIRADERNIGSNAVIRKNGFQFLKKETGPCSHFKPEPVTLNCYIREHNTMNYQEINAQTIDRWNAEGWEWGKPISHEDYLAAKSGIWDVLLTPTKAMPHEWIGNLKGKKLLGLASGGGQQIPIFAALGALCTVLDYSESQIQSELMVAEREGYEINAIRRDMTEPLPFENETFDIIFHPISNCYIEKVEPVFKECFRILKKGGILVCGLDNGINYIVDEKEEKIINYLPFNPLKNTEQMQQLKDQDCGVQFSHTAEEQIGGQLKAGFVLTDLYEDTNGEGRLHELHIPTFWATRVIKPL